MLKSETFKKNKPASQSPGLLKAHRLRAKTMLSRQVPVLCTQTLGTPRRTSHLSQSLLRQHQHLTSRMGLERSHCKAQHIPQPSTRTSVAMMHLHLKPSMTSRPPSTWLTSKHRSRALTSALWRCNFQERTCRASSLIHFEDAQLRLALRTEAASLHHGIAIATAPDHLVGAHHTKFNDSAPWRSEDSQLMTPCTCLNVARLFHVSIFSTHACLEKAWRCCVP